MEWPYTYTPFIWPLLASVAVMVVLGLYAMRHRAAPGGLPFFFLAVVTGLWSLANTLRQISTVDETRIFWFKFEAALLPSMASVALCFVLEYAGLGKWLTRRTIVLLAVMPLLYMLLVLTNGIHHLVWTRIWFEGHVYAHFGQANWWFVAYGYFLTLVHVIVLAWLFVCSPRHRWIAGLLMLTPLITRGGYILRIVGWNPLPPPFDPLAITINLALLPYILAFFCFHMFEAVPVARDTVIQKMPDGMMVLDAKNRIVDVNEKAQELLGIVRSNVIGGRIEEVLYAYPDLLTIVREDVTRQETVFENFNERWVEASTSPLIDRRGFHLGCLIWLHDMTERRQTQQKILDHERTLAMLKERELLARELHDGIGQMLAAAQLQIKSASDLIFRGEITLAESCLRRLGDVTQEAKESVRTYLNGVKAGSPSRGQSLVPSLRQYLDHFSQNYGIRTELIVSPDLEAIQIDASIEAQLQPIIQEALTNTRRHGEADSMRVILASSDGRIQVTIEDDGRGFNPAQIGEKQGFGVRSMQGRAEAMGGLFEVNSMPGKGTRVIVRIPWGKEKQ